MSLVRRMLVWWERCWFTRIPGESYALLRIAFGLLGLAEILSLTPVETFWTPDGLMPTPGGGSGGRAQLEMLGLAGIAGHALFGTLVVAFGAMTLGYRTRWAIAIAFAGSFLQQRFWNPLPLSSADAVIQVVLFYLLWPDCSGRPSVDAWLRRRGGVSPSEPDGVPVWPLRLIRLHVALIYVTTGLWKLANGAWRDGSALYQVLNLNTFARFPDNPLVDADLLLSLGAYTTLFWELSFPLLLLTKPSRRIALALGVLLHLGMWVLLEIGLFSAVMLACYLAFLDPMWIRRRASLQVRERSVNPVTS